MSGTIDKKEFRQGLKMLGLKDVSREQADELFDVLDGDHSGEIDYQELRAKLRQTCDPEDRKRRAEAKAVAKREAALREREEAGAAAAAEYKPRYKPRTKKAARTEALLAIKAQEVVVMHRLVSVQRELHRSQSESAVVEARQRNKRIVQEMKADMDTRVGRDLNAKFASIEMAPPDEVTAIATQLNQKLTKLAGMLPDAKMVKGPLWFALFKFMDDDRSGRISFSELSRGVRELLRMKEGEMPVARLQALWRALDEDCSGYVSCGEFGKFMRKGEGEGQQQRVRNAKAQLKKSRLDKSAAASAEHEARVGRDLAARWKDVPKASKKEAEELSRVVNVRFASKLALHRDGWMKFFRLMDDDNSGRIAYAELAWGLRTQLGFSKKELPELQLQALWKHLDADASGFICAGEFLRFVKRGASALPEQQDSDWIKNQQATRQRVTAEEEEWEGNALARAKATRQHVEREAAKLEAMLARSRVAKSQANLDPTRKAKKADAKKAGTFLTSASSSPSLPPINPQAARSAFAGKSERFDY